MDYGGRVKEEKFEDWDVRRIYRSPWRNIQEDFKFKNIKQIPHSVSRQVAGLSLEYMI